MPKMKARRDRVARSLLGSALVFLVASVGCESGHGPQGNPGAAAKVATGRAHVRPIFMRGPTGGAPIAPFIAAELQKGRVAHYGVLVYVGATWCEPCQRFHEAVKAGELDTLLDGVHLVEFDLDADRDTLSAAGYSSQLIPLFALPKTDGSGSADRIEGSVKGPAAVEQNLMPRLQAFLRSQASG
jgi:hypothetical protein